jgi:signal transduction histidine kinase/CheY-like chemotaxis protein
MALHSKRIRIALTALAGALGCFALLLTLQPAVPTNAGATATNSTIVKVGMIEGDTNPISGKINETTAFQKDYVQAIADYANWTPEYYVYSWNDLLTKTKEGSLDLLLDVTKTTERESDYNFSSQEMGTEMACLYAKSDTSLTYDDYAGFNGMKIGYELGSTILNSFQAYANDNSFTFTAFSYQSRTDLLAALQNGTVDGIVQTNYYDVSRSNVVLLAECKPSPVYIVTPKNETGNRLIGQLDNAMSLLFRYNPGFNLDLYRYHFATSASQETAYTKDELAYINSKPTVAFYYETNWAPFEYDDNGKASGITPDVVRAISELTNITFEFRLFSSTAEVYSGINGSPDAATAVSYNYSWANVHDLVVTQPYISGTVMRASKNATSTPTSVAVVEDGYLAAQISKKYPNLKQVSFQTFNECMAAVKSGQADCTFLNYYQANYYRSMVSYEDFAFQPTDAIVQSIGIGITTASNAVLLRVLSKALQHLSSTTLQSILSENSIFTAPFNVSTLMRHYPLASGLSIAAFALLLGVLLFFWISSAVRKRQALALENAKKEAEKASKAKSEFLSRMSHDIRTPLNGIIGMTYLAQEKNTDPAVGENLKKIDVSSKYLLSLINDILDMSKAESGQIALHPEPYPKKDIEEYLKAVIVPLCEEKKVTFAQDLDITEDPIPLLDKLRINQILFNLLSNAVKFTSEKGQVELQIKAEAASENKLAITIVVKDNGIGMSPEFQKVLFNPFTQEERSDQVTPHQGTGLGMAITKRLVDTMKGTIGVSSTIGQGTTFTVNLLADSVPLGSVQIQEDEKKKAVKTSSLKGKTILLFEDNMINQEIAKRLLVEKGAKVVTANDGIIGVDLFKKSKPGEFDLILMDIRMPNQDGYESTRIIRHLERDDAKKIPIIAMTADAFQDDVERSKQAGMNAHLSKPINPQNLYQTLEEFLIDKSAK